MKNRYLIILCTIAVILSLGCALVSDVFDDSVKFEPESLPNGQVGKTYEVEIRPVENRTPVSSFYILEGDLPPGLEFIRMDREDPAWIRGVPTEAGTFTFTVRVDCLGTNTAGQRGEKEYSIVVSE